jgi:aldehyde dehydrogenase (NAD+)
MDYSSVINPLRDTFRSGRTRPLAWRKAQLEALRAMLVEQEGVLVRALKDDVGKPELEGYLTDVGFVIAEIDHALANLGRWMKPLRVSTPLILQPGSSRVVHEPLGVALIIGAWNYPVQLSLAPLVACIAAGNCAVIKPSEFAPRCAEAMAKLLPRYLDPAAFAVVEGSVPETSALLEEQFDKIFFTGSSRVGRIVMAAAAKHLTPVTLELGGKSPCVVDEDVDLAVAARRITYGKFINAGQTCIAPDYVLVHKAREQALLDAITEAIDAFYGGDAMASEDFGRIIDARHHERLTRLIEGETVVTGGQTDANQLHIAPTVLRDVSPNAPVMREEIFGPVLPVLAVDDMEEAIRFINEREKPLALYVFSSNAARTDRIITATSAGGVCVNDTILHVVAPELPFGGVGESGMGKYHGRAGFEAFSNAKAVFRHSTSFDLSMRYPPFSKRDKAVLRAGASGLKGLLRRFMGR